MHGTTEDHRPGSFHVPNLLGTAMEMERKSVRLGISRCLMGEQVRYDGGHKHASFLVDALRAYVEWVPVCPEVEAGLGVPREPMQLMGSPEHPRLVTVHSRRDYTARMQHVTARCVRELDALDLAGYIFKKGSPSCGLHQVGVYDWQGNVTGTGTGLFARTIRRHFALLPVEEDIHLRELTHREHFFERVWGYRRWKDFLHRQPITYARLAAFHARNYCLLLVHHHKQCRRLGAMLAQADRWPLHVLAQRYGVLFMEALSVKPTRRQHARLLRRLGTVFQADLSSADRTRLLDVLHEYEQRRVPLLVPILLVRRYARRLGLRVVQAQTYLDPFPKRLAFLGSRTGDCDRKGENLLQ
ncbi:MAG: DUF1722 domain-containing protein [Nitrospirae bacterium]|nr:MAG: DUF1722 domain-containing protein [Nitrospirota bacterium]